VWRIETWKQKARELRTETYALYLAVKDPRVPWYAKFSAVCVVAYALSPIDLIPDFIPVLGYVDDLILIPLGIALTIRMIPPDVLGMQSERALKSLAKQVLRLDRSDSCPCIVGRDHFRRCSMVQPTRKAGFNSK
jgi:uncharacterized membrane protein YkvA (DUF1232 family)